MCNLLSPVEEQKKNSNGPRSSAQRNCIVKISSAIYDEYYTQNNGYNPTYHTQ